MKVGSVRRYNWSDPAGAAHQPARPEDPYRLLAFTLFDAAEDALLLLDTDAKVLAVNNAWAELTGYARELLIERSIYALSETMEPDGLVDWLAGTLPTLSAPVETRVHFRHRGGFRLDIAARIEPVRDSAQMPVLWLVRLRPVRHEGFRHHGRRTASHSRRSD